MSSCRNNIPPKFVFPQHFSGSGEWNGAIQPHQGPQAPSTPSGLAHLTSYNVDSPDYGHVTSAGGCYEGVYHGTAHMSNRAATVPYQRTPPTQIPDSSILATSPVELGLPSHRTTELWLRNHLKIPAPRPLNLWCLRELTSVKKLPNLTEMIFLAIWGSPYKRLGLSEIYVAIEDRYPILKTYDDSEKAWKRSIRHRLSLKACFVRIERDRRGGDWMIDVSKGLENGRSYKAPTQHNASGSSSDSQNHSGEDIGPSFVGYSSDSDSFLTPPPPEMSTAIQEYTYMGSGHSIHDLTEHNMGQNYDHMPY